MGKKRVIKSNCMKRRDAIREAKPTELTISQAFTEFIDVKELAGRTLSTLNNYRQSLGLFLEFNKFDDTIMKCDEIKLADIEEWVMAMLAGGEDEDGNPLPMISTAAINHYLRDLRAFFYWCMDEDRGYISKRFKIQEIKEQEEAPKCYTDDELAALLAKPTHRDSFSEWRTWAIVNWMLATGNRTSTVLNIKMKDIDFATGQVVLTHTKNKAGQTTFMSASLMDAIKAYLNEFSPINEEYNEEDYLFPDFSRTQLTPNGMRHAYQRYCESRGVSRTNLHGLRHTFAKKFIREGGKAAQLQKLLGHKTPAQTLHYIHFFDEEIKEDIMTNNPLDNFKKGRTREGKITRRRK